MSEPSVVVLCGGVGAARLLRGAAAAVDAHKLTAVVNTADDMILHGLSISPDLDTCTYTVAEQINPDTGWGLAGETWQARSVLDRYGGQTWFGLGDRDLGTHLYRTQRLSEGASLSEVTAEITAAWGIDFRIVPVTDDQIRSVITTQAGEVLDFQRWFVERAHNDPVSHVAFHGTAEAVPAPGVLDAIAAADCIVIAPSNPIVSIGPLLAIPGLRAALASRRQDVVAISPIIGGDAVKGPAASLLRTLGHEVSATGVARLYQDVAGHMIIDSVDRGLVRDIQQVGLAAHAMNTLMDTAEIAAQVTNAALDLAASGS